MLMLVALRKESVDRNPPGSEFPEWQRGSLSARRAWIEIPGPKVMTPERYVALRKESVDRNNSRFVVFIPVNVSLSARRAWIEINLNTRKGEFEMVALRKESVDRNGHLTAGSPPMPSRSPQGERG